MGQLANSAVLVDIRDLHRSLPVARWLVRAREWRMQDTSAILTPLTAFDGVYYVDEVSRAKLTPNALARSFGGNKSH